MESRSGKTVEINSCGLRKGRIETSIFQERMRKHLETLSTATLQAEKPVFQEQSYLFRIYLTTLSVTQII
jgi:hypothetical protein